MVSVIIEIIYLKIYMSRVKLVTHLGYAVANATFFITKKANNLCRSG